MKVFVADLDSKTRKWRPRRGHRGGGYSSEDLEDFRQSLKTQGGLEVEVMLVRARDCESTNPRDKVFAILGMLDDCQNDIATDYARSVSEVSVRFWEMVSVDERLDALVCSENANREQRIPSRAPNLCSSSSAQPSRLKGRSRSLYDATRASIDKYQFLKDSNTLDALGLIFDISQVVSKKGAFAS